MPLYRKKPIIVDAEQWFPQPPPVLDSIGVGGRKIPGTARRPELHGVRFIPANRQDMSKTRGILVDRPARYVIDTLEGPMDVRAGDWIITGIMGERYPCRDDIFRATYEPLGVLDHDEPITAEKSVGFLKRIFKNG